ncbi:hypothetical protein ACHAWF_010931, partial [Thalassiosira exigua]
STIPSPSTSSSLLLLLLPLSLLHPSSSTVRASSLEEPWRTSTSATFGSSAQSISTIEAMRALQPLLVFHAAGAVASFSAPTPTKTSAPWRGFLDSLFPSPDAPDGATSDRRRSELKRRLLAECRENLGRNGPDVRRRIEAVVEELAPLNPTPEPAANPLLKRKWILEWTSEKEINFFLERGIGEGITQTLGGATLENYIPFVKGGGFGVTGVIGVDEDAENGLMRTKFKFERANLNLGRWGEYSFPPVGEGWFDTIYLDEGEYHRHWLSFCSFFRSAQVHHAWCPIFYMDMDMDMDVDVDTNKLQKA